MFLRIAFPERFGNKEVAQDLPPLTLTAPKKTITLGSNVILSIHNTTTTGVTLTNRCPEPPLIIERNIDEKLYQLDLSSPIITSCETITEIPPQSKTSIDVSSWKYEAFKEPGSYRISIPIEASSQIGMNADEVVSFDITVKQPGLFTTAFRAFISKPLFNGLILIASLLPNHSLGWSIIIITLIVKLILFFPSQHALQSQKKMQAIQPKLDAIKKKFHGNQQKITEETMKIWKQEKINPMQSCLPTFIQLPILIGLFFIIRDSGRIELAQHLLYPSLVSLDWSFSTMFLGFLNIRNIPFAGIAWYPSLDTAKILLTGGLVPLIIAVMQFVQMKMAFAKKKNDDGKSKTEPQKPLSEQMDAQAMMMYMLPVMIFFISGSLPYAVSLYWGASTAFSIGQQAFVNRKKS